MSTSGSESSGATSPSAGEGSTGALTETDILDTSSIGEPIAGDAAAGKVPVSGVAESSDVVADSGVTDGDKLTLADVLPTKEVDDPTLGAYLTVETIGSNTVISVDADAMGGAEPVQVITLEGVTDMTLAQLLNNNPIIT